MNFENKVISIGELNLRQYDDIKSRCGQPPQFKIHCLPSLEKKLWGFRSKKLYIVAARTSHGKSTLMLQLAYDFARQGKIVHFHSFEMTQDVCAKRIISNRCGVDSYMLDNGNVFLEEFRSNFEVKYNKYVEEAKNVPLVIIESIGNSLPQLEALHSFVAQKPDAIFIDYGNLVAEQAGKTKKQSYDEYIVGLRALAIHKDICVVVGSQVNRNVGKNDTGKLRQPELHDMKETGVLEENADVVIMLYCPDHEQQELVLNVAKNRDGRTGCLPCLWIKEHHIIIEDENKIKEIKNKRIEKKEVQDGQPRYKGNRQFGY